MALSNYGVLYCTPAIDTGIEDDATSSHLSSNTLVIPVLVGEKPHSLQVRLGTRGDRTFCCCVDFHFHHGPLCDLLRDLKPGFTRLPSKKGSGALDYVRGGLLDWGQILTVGDTTAPSCRGIWVALGLGPDQRAGDLRIRDVRCQGEASSPHLHEPG